ncbi:MAG: 50S ribosomal protein L13 [Candidatus Binatia bacterium]|nr:MAG: 50S ribosomal protein L13 [Candidatus Binatia bacterium]
MRKTVVVNREDALAQRGWVLIDAKGQVLGRVASAAAQVVRGKHKPTFQPWEDVGDFVVIINAAEVRLTGSKWRKKEYIRHTGYPGGVRVRTALEQKTIAPEEMLRRAIVGMLPKNRLGHQLATKVKIYPGPSHPHEAQRPVVLSLSVQRRVGE